MPVVGQLEAQQEQQRIAGDSYRKNPMYSLAKNYLEMANHILEESTSNIDIFETPNKVFGVANRTAAEAMKEFFVSDIFDENDVSLDTEDRNDLMVQMEQQYVNDVAGINENASIGGYNPVIGMVLPVHKNILMNMVFDKGGIDKFTTASPKFTITMETRLLVAPDGTEIDMFLEQNKMTAAIDQVSPTTVIEISVPEFETVDFVADLGGTAYDNLSIDTEIAAVLIPNVYYEVGDILPDATTGYVPTTGGTPATTAGNHDTWFKVSTFNFTPGYGSSDTRTLSKSVKFIYKKAADDLAHVYTDQFSGTLTKNKMVLSLARGAAAAITKVRIKTRLETSNANQTAAKTRWKTDTIIEEIADAKPMNTTITPDEIKDLAALRNVNQLTKLMSMFKTALANYKDDHIKMGLDESYEVMDARAKHAASFNWAPSEISSNYALDPVTWRQKTFFDWFDMQITTMIQVLNDPNITVSIYGNPDIVRRITPTSYSYQAPSNIGPVEIDFTRTVVTGDKRVYNFCGSDKLRGSNELIVLLNPRNTDRIIYRIYDYMMYVSNEIRNVNQPQLPSIHAYERWKLVAYQPVQSRITIKNPSGYVGY